MAGDSEVRIALRVAATLKGTMVRAGQSSEKAALIYQHSDHERQKEVAGGLDGMVRAAREKAAEQARQGSSGADVVRDPNWSRQRTSPRSLTWGFCMERMTGIEPAL